jgi:hypothetical protein
VLLFAIARSCYELIGVCCTGNPSSKAAMLPHISMMNSHLNYNVGAYETIISIYSDSSDLLEALDDSTFIWRVETIKANKLENQRHLSLIMGTCVCGDMPITRNQDRLVVIDAHRQSSDDPNRIV